MAKGAKVAVPLEPLGPEPTEKGALKAWQKEKKKRDKVKAKEEKKARKARDKEEKKRKKNVPLREAPAILNNQSVAPHDKGALRGRYNVHYGMNAFGRASYMLLMRGAPPPSPCCFAFPRWFVVQYKMLKIYEYKADARPHGETMESLHKPMISIKLNHPHKGKVATGYTVKVTPWSPLVDVAKLMGGKQHYYIKITLEKVGPDEVYIIDCINRFEQERWIDVIEAACERDFTEAVQAEMQDRDTRKDLLAAGMSLAQIEQEMMGAEMADEAEKVEKAEARQESKKGPASVVPAKPSMITKSDAASVATKSDAASEEPEEPEDGGDDGGDDGGGSGGGGGADPVELAAVKEQLAAQGEELAGVREAMAQLEADIVALQADKDRAVADLEALLAANKVEGEAKQREAQAEISSLKKVIDDREKEIANAAAIKKAKANEFQRMLAVAREKKSPAKRSAPPPV